MKNILLIFFTTIHFIQIFSQEFTLTGNIPPMFNDKPIMLFSFHGDSIISIDTAIVRDEIFVFRRKEYLSDQSMATTGNYPEEIRSVFLILEHGNICINLLDFYAT